MRNIVSFLVVVSLLVVPAAGGAIEEGTGAVWGTVIDAVTERPVGGVCVAVYGFEMAPTDYSGFTNKDGVYEIGGMTPGEYVLEFDDCERDAYDTVQDVAVVTTETATKVDQFLALRDGVGAVVGFVRDAGTQQGIKGACAVLFHAADDIVAGEAVTGSDGGYQLAAPVGDYRVKFAGCDAGSYETQWFDHAESWDTSTVVSIKDHVYQSDVDADLAKEEKAEGALVWGYVVDGETGDGVAGYCVSVYHGETKVKTVLTGPEGGYEMEIDPIETRLKAWACEGHEDLGTVWYLDGEEFGDADPFVPAAGTVEQLETMIVGDIRFADAIDSVFHDDIVWLAREGITSGCTGDGTLFCPSDHVTRGQMAAFLHRALGDLLEGKGEAVFTDDDASIFEEDIEWLASVGVTSGCGEGVFCPNAKVTRAQMAAFLHRALDGVLEPAGEAVFTDDDASIFEKDIEWLASVGVTSGCGDGVFCPNDNVTRAQMAAFLHRALSK